MERFFSEEEIKSILDEYSDEAPIDNYEAENAVEYLTLNEYLLMAKKILKKYARNILKITDENIGIIASKIMMGESRYNPEFGTKRSSFRMSNGRWAIYDILRNQKRLMRLKTISLDTMWTDSRSGEKPYTIGAMIQDKRVSRSYIQRMIDSDKVNEISNLLTEKQINHLKMYYLEGLTMVEIAKIEGVTKQNISYCIGRSVKQLKKDYNIDGNVTSNKA